MRPSSLFLLAMVLGCGGDDGGTATDASVDSPDAPIDGPPDCGISPGRSRPARTR